MTSIRLLLASLFTLFACQPGRAGQQDLAAPADSGTSYAANVTVLPNGNIVVTDQTYSPSGAAGAGAVYLLDGATLSVISTLKGSAFNDQVGSSGVTVLSNGNFVVRSTTWNGGRGAATWGSATTGFIGGGTVTVSAANSLVGSTANDFVSSNGVIALTNGHYVVRSSSWNNGAATLAGAATWGNGSTGTVGTVSAANSLVGSTANDSVSNTSVTALTNGHYVVASPNWDNGATNAAGAVTWGNGNGGTVGAITSANSLVGDTTSDFVGIAAAVALTNGNYVVRSASWHTSAGAVTWGNGSTGTAGVVSAANSLVGTSAASPVGSGLIALTNGNYVVASSGWDNPSGNANVGAVTWCDGSTGRVGNVTAANSLTGSTANDAVGSPAPVALTNGNYVVLASAWDNGATTNVGAATWCDGSTGRTGTVSTANSLVGGTVNDNVGNPGATALTNGHYVVRSTFWSIPAGAAQVGAATWGNGSTGTVGTVSTSNSLVGSTASDQVSSIGITALTNGHYVVASSSWDNGGVLNRGAATWCNGTTGGTVGAVSSANSLIGSTLNDLVGNLGVVALTNGNYVVRSSNWNNGAATLAGAATWGNGNGGTVGAVSAANSLVGSTASDAVSGQGVLALPNGDYLVSSNVWDNPSGPVVNARALSYGNGHTGTSGAVSAANSVLGTVAPGIGTVTAANFDPVRSRTFVGRGSSKLLSILTQSPVITTPTSTAITSTGATLGGDVTADSGSAITERGVVYAPTATDSDPNVGDPGVTTVAEGGTTTGVFTQAITGLTVGTAYSFKAYVTNALGTSHTTVGTFTTVAAPAPTVTLVSPATGSTAGGESVTLTGTDFTGVTSVTFGGIAAPLTAATNTSLQVTTPPHAAGQVSVVVTTPGGTNLTPIFYTYASVPDAPTGVTAVPGNGSSAVSFTPPVNDGGSIITGYVATSNPSGIIGICPGNATSINVTPLTNGISYTFTVKATNAIGDSAPSSPSNAVTPRPAPTVTGVTPNAGAPAGNDVVTLTGTNLTGATAVTFGGTAATSVTVDSATQITATTPAHAAGAVSVNVTTPSGTNGANTLYTYGVPTVQQWVMRYNGPANDGDYATATAVDGSGNVAVTGFSYNASGYTDYYTAKYAAADGALLWQVRYNGSANSTNQAYSVAVDAAGNVAVTGQSWNGSNVDYYTAKYAAADGALLWEQRYNGTGNDTDIANSVAVDAAGNVAVTGYSSNGVNYDSYTAKYAAADGALLWQVRYIGTGNSDDVAFSVAVDAAGNVAVTGFSTNASGNTDYYTAKYAAADGALLWEKRYNGTGNGDDFAFSAAVDAAGNVAVTGQSWNGSNVDYYTAKYAAADGALLWEQRYNGTGNSDDVGYSVAVDAAGNVAVTGLSFNASNADYYTAKYAAADGALLWEQRYNGTGNSDDVGYSVAVDAAGNVAVTGQSVNLSGNYDYYTAKYAAATGALLWEQRYNGPANSDDAMNNVFPYAGKLALTPDGGAVVTGQSWNGTTYDYATVKYAPPWVAPTLTSVSPGTGTTAGGSSVTLTGNNFTGATAVTFGGTAATSFTVDSATQITATTPAHAAGAVSVLVTTPGGTNAANTLYTYVSPNTAPVVAVDGPDVFSVVGGLAAVRYYHTASVLANGKVLVTGGTNINNYEILSSAELYDAASNTWTAAGSLATARYSHTASVLANGKVLITGGGGSSGQISSAELYDPATNTWTAAGNLTTARIGHTASVLANGKVLVTGGYNDLSGLLVSAELYDPASNTWTAAGSLATVRRSHTASVLANGQVLVTGGYGPSGYLSSAELYDAASNTWTTAGSLATARSDHTASVLANGQVLVTGGFNFSGYLSSVELYDPATNTWTAAGSLATAHSSHTASVLANGQVLVTGDNNGTLCSAELYDPASNTWTAAGSLATTRRSLTASVLANGQVLITGVYNNGGSYLSSAELYGRGVTATEGSPATQTGTFSDAEGNGTVTLNASSGTVTQNNAAGTWSWSATGADGPAASTVAITATDTASATAIATFVVAVTNAAPTLAMSAPAIAGSGTVVSYTFIATDVSTADQSAGFSLSLNYGDGTTVQSVAAGTASPLARTHTFARHGFYTVTATASDKDGGVSTVASQFITITGPEIDVDGGGGGSLATGRFNHTASVLANGQVLATGGYNYDQGGPLSSAELYDPATNAWTAAGSLATERSSHTSSVLANGQVLVTGGYNFNSGSLSSAELYDPASNTWTAAGSLVTARYYHTASVLANGKVLVPGGNDGNGSYLSSAELYDPATNTWTAAGSLATERYAHTASVLANGKVLVTGGLGYSGPLSSAELYDPATNAWTTAGTLATERYAHTASVLANGKVLVTGGNDGNGGYFSSAELYDPATNTWTTAGSLTTARSDHTASVLANGQVLVIGGQEYSDPLSSAELYDPVTNTWTAAGSLATERYAHTASVLANGQVLVTGGLGYSGPLSSAELYGAADTSEGSPGTMTGTFSDAAGNATVTLTASSGSITQDNAAGTWSWSATGADGPATSTITITATDTASATATASFTFTVTNVAPAFDLGSNDSLPVGSGALSRTVSFTDPGTDVWSGTVDYGDGSGTVALSVNQGAKTFALSHTYATTGTFTVSVTLNDDDGGSATDTYTVTTLLNTAPAITSNGGGATASISVPENTTAVTTVVATDSDLPAQTITFSKSGSDAALFNIDSSTGVLTFAAAPDFETNPGPFSVTVTATDNGTPNLSDSQDLTITVTNKNEMPSFALSGTNPRHPYQTSDAQSTNAIATSINDGDSTVVQALTFNVSNNLNGLFSVQPAIDSSTGDLTYTLSGTSGVATVSVTLTDDNTINGDPALTTATQTITITVDPAPDYTIVTSSGVMTITDQAGNGDTLDIAEPVAGSIKFAAAGRTFSVNGALNTTGDSGSVTLAGITGIIVKAGGGADTINVGGFSGTSFPSLTLNGGTGDDTVNLNGDITFAANANLDVDLQNDDATPGIDVVNVATNANIITSGTGSITVKVSKNIAMASGSSLETVNGNLIVEANQQTVASTGNFTGVAVISAVIQATGTGTVSVAGRGGDAAGGAQHGVNITGSAKISGGTTPANALTITGTGGSSSGTQNYGVILNGAGQGITSAGANVQVTGQGGGAATATDSFGVYVFNNSLITAGAGGTVTVNGTGAPSSGNGNRGVGITRSTITSTSGNVSVTGTGGGTGTAGDAHGVIVHDGGTLSAGGTGTVTVLGTGGPGSGARNTGVAVFGDTTAGSKITSGVAAVQVTGVAGSGTLNLGIELSGTQAHSITTATSGGSITLIADSMSIGSSQTVSAQSGSSVTLKTRTSGALLDLGGADVLSTTPQTLGLTDAELDRITAGTLNLGSATSGNITVSAAISPANAPLVNLITGASIKNTNAGTTLTAANSTSSGTLAPGASPGIFSIAGNHTLSSSSTFSVEIGGTTAGTQYDQLSATGAVNIASGVALSPGSFSGFVPLPGQNYTIINRTGGTGTFQGLPEGALISSNFLGSGFPAFISYVGGTGDDVVITTANPDIQVEQPLTNILVDGTSTVDFGSLGVGLTGAPKTFTITNTGSSDLHLGLLTATGATADFAVNTGGINSTLTPSATTTFTVAFHPTAGGTRNAVLHIASDDPDESPFDINLTGIGLPVFPVNSALGDVVTNNFAPNPAGANDGTQFDVLGRGGYLAANGVLGFPGTLKIAGSVTTSPNNFQGYWKDDGSGLKRLVRSGDVMPGAGGAVLDALPTIPVPGMNPQGIVTILGALRPGTGVVPVTTSDDSAMWSEAGGNGLQLLMRENDAVPGVSGAFVSSFGFGCYATATTGGGTGEAAFTVKMKGASTDSVLLRESITGPGTATMSIVARENTAAAGTSENFGGLNSLITSCARMDTAGNIVFAAVTKPSGNVGFWYQARGSSSITKTAYTSEAAPGTSGSTFYVLELPSMGSGGTYAFVGYLHADGDNTANDKNNGVWRGTGTGPFTHILRRGDPALPGMPVGSKVGNLWSGWLNQNNHGAWRGWVDTAGDGISPYPADTFGIYTDMGGTMRLLISSGDAAPGVAGATLFYIDHPVVSGALGGQNEYVAFLGTLAGSVTPGVNDKGIWRSANGGAPTLLLRTGDTITTTQGTKTVYDIDLPGSNMDIRPWELPVMDDTGRLLLYITFTDGSTSQVIAP